MVSPDHAEVTPRPHLHKAAHTRAAAAPEKILLLRLSSIGDVVLITPLLRNLRRRFPHAAIDMVVKAEFAGLVRQHPALNTVHAVQTKQGLRGLLRLGLELRRRQYDAVLDLHRNFRTALLGLLCAAPRRLGYRKHRVRRWLYVHLKTPAMAGLPPIAQRYVQAASPLGVQDDGAGTEIFWTPAHEQEAEAALLAAGWKPGQNLIGLAPGAGYFTKRWPADFFAALAALLLQEDPACALVLVGGEMDREPAQNIRRQNPKRILDLTGGCSLLAAAAVIKRCRLLVANDSGLMHIAEAVRTPLVAIFGSTTQPLGFFPQRAASRVLENQKLDCRPCSHLGYRTCPRGHFRCMREIMPSRVYEEIQNLLAEQVRP